MIRRTRFRTILALFAAYLLMTTGVAQAAQPPKTDPTQGGSGGPAKVQQLRQDLLKKNAERKAAAEAGKKETPPAQPKKAERQTTVNPEPAFSAQSLAAPTAVPVPDQWQMLLSRDQFIPGEQTVVTGQLTAGGVPVAGATVRIGWNGMYGSYTTDSAGSVTFPYKAAYGPEAVPVEVQTATGTGRPAFLYTVPEGYSILTITSATDQNDAPLPFTFVSLSYYYPDHPGWSLHSGGMGYRDVFGSVRPAGLNHVEIASPSGVYLYEAVTLAPGERRSLQLSGAGAQPLTVSATFEGVPVGGQVYLHSERMDRESRYAWPLPPQVWVKPGAYSVLFKGNGPNTLFYRSGVSVTGPTALPFTETITSIAKVSVYSSDGYGKPFKVEHGKMTAGSIGFDLQSGLTYLATPGIGYRAWDYSYRTSDETGQPWSYNFFADATVPPQVPAKGTEVVLTLGGPISVQLGGYGEPYEPGGRAYWFGTLRTPSGDEFLPQQGGSRTTGTLALRDAAGNVIWKAPANLPSFWVEMPLPQTAGVYTLTGDFPTGPYQPGPLHIEREVIIQAKDQPMQVTVTPNVIPADALTAVTVQVTRGGQPVANQPVFADGQVLGMTDGAGTAIIRLMPGGYGHVIPVMTRDQMGRPYGANLFALLPDQAAMEVSASDRNGAPLWGYWASVNSPTWYWEAQEQGFPVGLIATPGPVEVDVVREGSDAYFMHQSAVAAPMALTRVHLDGRQTVELKVSSTLDGGPLAEAWAAFIPAGQQAHSTLWGAWLGDQGQGGLVYVTPGAYSALVRGRQGETVVFATVDGLNLTQPGPVQLALSSGQMGRVDLMATLKGQPQKFDLVLAGSGTFMYLDGARSVLLSAGTYVPVFMRAWIETGWYELHPENAAPLFVGPGSMQTRIFDLTVARAAVNLETPMYLQAGDQLVFHPTLETADGWRYAMAYDNNWLPAAPLTITITDAAGVVVYKGQQDYPGWTFWPVPAELSDSYTVTATRDLGAVGLFTVAETAKLYKPIVIDVRLDQVEVLVGRSNPVKVTVMKDGLPVEDAVVRSPAAPGSVEAKTNKHGEATLPVHPTAAGPVVIEIVTPAGDTATVEIQAVAK